MKYFKKNIILLSLDENKNAKGILTISDLDNVSAVSLKLYNTEGLNDELFCCVHIGNNEAEKFLMKQNFSQFNFTLSKRVKPSQEISCVIIRREKNADIPLIFGSTKLTQGFNTFKKYYSVESVVSSAVTIEKSPVSDEEIIIEIPKFAPEEKVESAISDEPKNKCETCEYKREFFKESNFVGPENNSTHTFFDSVKSQIESIFANGKRFKVLESFVENSRWVKVNYLDEKFYCMGVIFSGDYVEYLAYALPGNFSGKAPEGLDKYSKWLPLPATENNNTGYWFIVQSAVDGSYVENA